MLSSTWVGVGGTGLLLSFVLVFCSSFASWASVATAISGTSSDVCSLTPDTSSGFYKVLLRISSYSSSCGHELAEKYEIMTIPAFIIVKNGAETGRTIGVQPKEDILKLI